MSSKYTKTYQLKPVLEAKSAIDLLEVSSGQLLVSTDSQELFVDAGSSRLSLKDIVYVADYDSLPMIPLNKIYMTLDTYKLYYPSYVDLELVWRCLTATDTRATKQALSSSSFTALDNYIYTHSPSEDVTYSFGEPTVETKFTLRIAIPDTLSEEIDVTFPSNVIWRTGTVMYGDGIPVVGKPGKTYRLRFERDTDSNEWIGELVSISAFSYTKTEMDSLLENKIDASDIYTKAEIDEMLEKAI